MNHRFRLPVDEGFVPFHGSVPRSGDLVELRGQTYRVTEVLWASPGSFCMCSATVSLEEVSE